MPDFHLHFGHLQQEPDTSGLLGAVQYTNEVTRDLPSSCRIETLEAEATDPGPL